MAKFLAMEPAHFFQKWAMAKIQKWAQFEIDVLVTKTMFGDRKSKASSSADTWFLEIDKTCPKSFVQSIFLFYPQLWLKWSLSTKNEQNLIEIDNLATKTLFGDQEIKASSSADTFLEIGKICPRWFVQSIFYLIPNYG